MEYTQRQKEIIEKSIKIIAQKGIQKLTTKNLAIEMGLSEAALYRHFPGKLEILKAVLNSFELISQNVLEKIPEDVSPLEKIGIFLNDRYYRFSQNKEMAKVLFSEEVFQNEPELATMSWGIMHTHKESLQQFISEGQTQGTIRNDISTISLFRIIIGSMRLLVTQWSLSGYQLNLEDEGSKLWNEIKLLLIKQE